MAKIYYAKPSITELEVRYATDAAANGWGERCHEYIDRFEAAFCEHIGAPHAIATSSCTGALHMGLAALGVSAGDEVILGDVNWIASAAPITYLGARPVLVDVLPDSWCLDPQRVAAAITRRTKAIIAVHLYGNMCDMDALLAIGAKHGIPVVEDAAEALGSEWRGRKAGTLGAFGAFSFHGSKTLTTGEGGMFVTSDPSLYDKVMTLTNHGRARGQVRQFWPDLIGFKYKLSNIQAALGCAQLERIDELLAAKRSVFSRYRELLGGLPLAMNPEPPGTRNGYWMPTIVFDEALQLDRERLLAQLRQAEIDGRVFFWPLSSLPMFESMGVTTPVAHSLSRRAINLPSYHDISDADLQRVASVVRRFATGNV